MRTRKKSYEDYGLTKDEIKDIKNFCMNADAEQKEDIIKVALSELSPYIALKCLESLIKDKSYEDLCKYEYIFLGKADFYGYRRKGMEAIKRWMILNNKWNYKN